MCWNKGIETILRCKAAIEAADVEDVGMDDSYADEDKEFIIAAVADPANSMLGGKGLPWCEIAIEISSYSAGKLQCAGMQNLLAKLVKESAVSGGFSTSGKSLQPDH